MGDGNSNGQVSKEREQRMLYLGIVVSCFFSLLDHVVAVLRGTSLSPFFPETMVIGDLWMTPAVSSGIAAILVLAIGVWIAHKVCYASSVTRDNILLFKGRFNAVLWAWLLLASIMSLFLLQAVMHRNLTAPVAILYVLLVSVLWVAIVYAVGGILFGSRVRS